MNKFVKDFTQINARDVQIAGGKAASLGEMTKLKISVPPGFVVLASAFDTFLADTEIGLKIDSILHEVRYEHMSAIEDASKKIRGLIAKAAFPSDQSQEIYAAFSQLGAKYVAVRSSATAEDSSDASWAGELESYLNTTKTGLLGNIKQCWSSLFTPRAIFYRYEKKLHGTKVSVAVAVQEMIQSEVSGICFTVHPLTHDHDQMIIEAGYGLGEAIVSGTITPDNYIVQKNNWIIFDKNIHEQKIAIVKRGDKNVEQKIVSSNQKKQKLADEKIIELAKICKKLELHYKYPQDIEWAFENGKFYIVQSRPITTLY